MRFASWCAPWRLSTSRASSKPLGTRRRRRTNSSLSSGIDLLRRSSRELMTSECFATDSYHKATQTRKLSRCFFQLAAMLACENHSDMNLSPRTKLRLLGALPLLFFLAQVVHYWRQRELGHMLWMCNIGNLLLAIGLFLEKPQIVRLAAIWTIPGLVVWFLYVVLVWTVFLSSFLAHVGGLVVAMIALSRYGMDRN